jgi:hypothetical protein
MSTISVGSRISAPAVVGRGAVEYSNQARRVGGSRIWALVEALAYAGAAIDPTAALAAQRFARIRDEERRGRG